MENEDEVTDESSQETAERDLSVEQNTRQNVEVQTTVQSHEEENVPELTRHSPGHTPLNLSEHSLPPKRSRTPPQIQVTNPMLAMGHISLPNPPRTRGSLIEDDINVDMLPIPEESEETHSAVQIPSDPPNTEDLDRIMQDLLMSTPQKITPTVDFIVDLIQKGECQNIITMAGAGISTAAGIPDFRTPGSGLYHKKKYYTDLPYPEAIFDLKYFMMNPKPFFDMISDLMPGSYRPTKAHHFIKLLQTKNLLLRHYTQNIDNLERIVGISEDKLVEAHGTFYRSHCLRCGNEYTFEWLADKIHSNQIPTCSCEGIVKPDIIFYGEPLPPVFHEMSAQDFGKCDLLIIMGSSLQVEPFASLCDRVKQNCIRLFINKDEGVKKTAKVSFDMPKNVRDVTWTETCDTACEILASKLGWTNEWLELMH